MQFMKLRAHHQHAEQWSRHHTVSSYTGGYPATNILERISKNGIWYIPNPDTWKDWHINTIEFGLLPTSSQVQTDHSKFRQQPTV